MNREIATVCRRYAGWVAHLVDILILTALALALVIGLLMW